MTTIRRAAASISLPLTTGWGIRLAVATALISGMAVWLNAFAVRQVPDPAVYTTLKNLVAAAILVAGASMMGGAAEVRSLDRRRWGLLLLVGLIGGSVPFLLLLNKADLNAEWQVDEQSLRKLVDHGWRVIRTSAKTGDGVDDAFAKLAREMT